MSTANARWLVTSVYVCTTRLPAGIRTSEHFSQLDGFVDGNDRRDVVAVQHFVNREPQNVSIHG